ncbi:DUF4055 domain-containing protein [Fundidesulfovibrio butyratiphilus]
MSLNTKKTVATARDEMTAYLPKLQVVKDLMGGQDDMRKAGKRYLVQFEQEPAGKWEARVAQATLLNAYERTLAYLCGQVFSKDLRLQGDGETEQEASLGEFAAMVENADGEGNSISVWSKRAFHRGLNDGFGAILVDAPAMVVRQGEMGREYLKGEDAVGNEVWAPLTAATAEAEGLRPRLIYVSAESVLGWRYELVGGAKKLVMFRFLESYKEAGEWDSGDEEKPQVRVLTPGRWQVWRRVNDEKDEWGLHSEGALPMRDLPVVFFRPGKPLSEVTCEPALRALADKNVEHWQKQAEHNQLMTWVRSPGMYAAGIAEESDVPFGPGIMTKLSDPTGRIAAIGQDPSSVAASRQELEDLVRQMALFGLQLLMPRTGDVTATERSLSSAENDSTLKGWALEWKDALEQALVFAAVFMGSTVKPPSVVVNTEYRPPMAGDDLALQILVDTYTKGLLSRKTLWAELVKRGILSDDFDPDAEAEAITKDQYQARPFGNLAGDLLGGKEPGPQAGQARGQGS